MATLLQLHVMAVFTRGAVAAMRSWGMEVWNHVVRPNLLNHCVTRKSVQLHAGSFTQQSFQLMGAYSPVVRIDLANWDTMIQTTGKSLPWSSPSKEYPFRTYRVAEATPLPARTTDECTHGAGTTMYSWAANRWTIQQSNANQNWWSPFRMLSVLIVFRNTWSLLVPRSSVECGIALPPARTLRAMASSMEFPDVTFLVEGEKIQAHRSVLAVQSDYFGKMLRSEMRESSAQMDIPVPNVRKHIFSLLLKYLYNAFVFVESSDAVDLYALADMYQLVKLKEICRESLEHGLAVENVVALLLQAAESGYDELKDDCLKFLVRNLAQVSGTDAMKELRKNPELLLAIISKAGDLLQKSGDSRKRLRED